MKKRERPTRVETTPAAAIVGALTAVATSMTSPTSRGEKCGRSELVSTETPIIVNNHNPVMRVNNAATTRPVTRSSSSSVASCAAGSRLSDSWGEWL